MCAMCCGCGGENRRTAADSETRGDGWCVESDGHGAGIGIKTKEKAAPATQDAALENTTTPPSSEIQPSLASQLLSQTPVCPFFSIRAHVSLPKLSSQPACSILLETNVASMCCVSLILLALSFVCARNRMHSETKPSRLELKKRHHQTPSHV